MHMQVLEMFSDEEVIPGSAPWAAFTRKDSLHSKDPTHRSQNSQKQTVGNTGNKMPTSDQQNKATEIFTVN